ncbi:ROK family transcriptional regulator [Nocardioides montaniterrae]
MTSEPREGSLAGLREFNRARIIGVLRAAGELSQADLVRHTGLSAATISNIVRDLDGAGLVTVRTKGRRRTVRLQRVAGFVVGVDYGHRHLSVAVADLAHEVLAEQRVELHEDIGARAGLALAAERMHQVLDQAGVAAADVVSVAIGLPAPIEAATARVGAPSILPGWVGVPVREVAAAAFGLEAPLAVDNDANLGALAEHRWGAGMGCDDLAYLKISEGVGAGLVLGGRAYAGPTGTAGEIGHLTVDEMGAVCRCGNRGCLETLVSARSVASILEPTHGPGLTIRDIVQAADDGDRACARVLTDVGTQVGRAVADLCSLLNPTLVVVGGELAQANDYLLPAIRRVVARCSVPAAADRLQLRTAALGDRAHLLGAIARALDPLPVGRLDGRRDR